MVEDVSVVVVTCEADGAGYGGCVRDGDACEDASGEVGGVGGAGAELDGAGTVFGK